MVFHHLKNFGELTGAEIGFGISATLSNMKTNEPFDETYFSA
jgi:hypothetical protein